MYAWGATKISRFIAGGAPISRTFWISSATSRAPAPSGWNRITGPPRTSWRPPARWWRITRRARAKRSGPRRTKARCWVCPGGGRIQFLPARRNQRRRSVSETGGVESGFGESAARDQHAGARHRPHHGGPGGRVRAGTWTELVGRRVAHDRPAIVSGARAVGVGGVPDHDSGTAAAGYERAAAGCHTVHAGPHRLRQDAGAGGHSRIGRPAGEPRRAGERGRGSRGARRNPGRFPGSCGPGGGRRRGGRTCAGEPVDAAQRQGSGVSYRVFGGHGRGAVPASAVHGLGGGARRRAALMLRGDDARAKKAVSDLGQVSAPIWWRGTGAHGAVTVSE